MTIKLPLLAALGIANCVMAQTVIVSSPTPICFTINDVGAATPAGSIVLTCSYVDPSAGFVAHFVAPASASVDYIAIWEAPQNVVTYIELYATTMLGGSSTGSALGTFGGYHQSTGDVWYPCWKSTSAPPVVLAAGSTYAIRIKQSSAEAPWWGCACYTFAYDPTGATPLIYHYTSGSSCAPSIPSTGQLALPIRFGGFACGPGPLASVQWVGSSGACGGSDFAFTVPPVLGRLFPLSVDGPAGETAFLFWANGVIQNGSIPLAGPFSPCGFRLDLPSFYAFAAMGAEPLASGVLAPTPSGSGIVNWSFDIPGSPALAGFQIGIQSIVVGPSGTPLNLVGLPFFAGLFGANVSAHVTPPYLLMLGY